MVEETQPPEEAQQTGEEVAKQEVTKEDVTREETVVAGGEDARERLGPGLLWIAALALIAVPVLIGFIFLRGGDESTGGIGDDASSAEAADAGMGGGMGDTASAAGGVPVGVGNIEDILASDIVIEPDATGSGVVVRLTTSIEVACAVSYGIDTDLGSIATDSDMAGGGHLDHHPVLRGLNPGVTYSYRLSAIGPDGRLYQSGLREFTFTPGETATAGVTPAPDVAPPAPNVAGMATVADVSSEYSDAFAAAMAIDGDLSTEWSSDGDGDDAFIVLDFGEEMIVQGVGLRTREMSDGTSITTSFTVTANGTTYGPFQAGPGLAVGLADFVGQSIRFDVDTSTGGNTGAIEVEVYGETDM